MVFSLYSELFPGVEETQGLRTPVNFVGKNRRT